jgi:site-specific DNA recombinase
MKRAAIYTRVSREDSAKRGHSLTGQADLCRSYAEREGYQVVLELREEGISGATPFAERPEGARLVEAIRKREVDAVICYAVDRLSRDSVEGQVLNSLWQSIGVELHALDAGGKIEGKNNLLLAIKSIIAAEEREKTRQRSMDNKADKARNGKIVGSRAPYGYALVYDRDSGRVETLAPVEERAEIVRRIFAWYAMGDETGQPLPANAIARRLSEMGVPSPGEVHENLYHRTRGPGMWRSMAVLEILKNEVYAGVWNFRMRLGWNQRSQNPGSGPLRPRDEWIPVPVPALVERELWDAAQARRANNRQSARYNAAKWEYLLLGRIRCACGRAMGGDYSGRKYRIYRCGSRLSRHAGLEPRDCWQADVKVDALEADVWESILGLFGDTERLERLLREAQRQELAAQEPKRDTLAAVESQIARAERDAAEIAQALIEAEGIVQESLKARMREVNDRHAALKQSRETLRVALEGTRLSDAAILEVLDYAQGVRAGMENADYLTKRRKLESLEVRVVVDGNRYTVTSLAGEWSGEIRELPDGRWLRFHPELANKPDPSSRSGCHNWGR